MKIITIIFRLPLLTGKTIIRGTKNAINFMIEIFDRGGSTEIKDITDE